MANVERFPQAIEIDPFQHVVYSNRSASYLSNGEPNEALADAEKCVELAPKWAKGFGRKGAALFALGSFEDALAAYKSGAHCVTNLNDCR